MDNELLERLARDAGYDLYKNGSIVMPYMHVQDPTDEREYLTRFAALIAEECAKLVDAEGYSHTAGLSQWTANLFQCSAEAIRAKFSVPAASPASQSRSRTR